jgi:triacylglycerol lipase
MRRLILGAILLLSLVSGVRAQTPPPIIFVHGNGDTSGLWITTFWRFEANGYPKDRLFAIDLRNPNARTVDATPQPGRSSTTDVRDQLAAEVTRVRALTGADKVVLVAQSRGGNTVRNYLKNGGGAAFTSLAVLCGAVNHGVLVSDKILIGSEFNGGSDFMKDLNSTPGEVVAGVRFVTIRSTQNDKFAQPDGAYLGAKGMPTGVGFDGPALKGAENIAIDGLDHRETGYGIAAFPALFKAVTGHAPTVLVPPAELHVVLNGVLTGLDADQPSNIALPGATVTVWKVASGERLGAPLRQVTTGADGVWGPVTVGPTDALEFEIAAPNLPTTHIYRAPFPRSSAILQLHPQPFGKADAAAEAVVYLTRPRGYFGIGRDTIQLDGAQPGDIQPGVPSSSTARLATAPGRVVVGQFNDEVIAARSFKVADKQVSVIEITE